MNIKQYQSKLVQFPIWLLTRAATRFLCWRAEREVIIDNLRRDYHHALANISLSLAMADDTDAHVDVLEAMIAKARQAGKLAGISRAQHRKDLEYALRMGMEL